MEPLYQIPPSVRNELSTMRGNDTCFECKSRDTDWGSVSMGTLLCIECAGKHRGYGVSVSFIRSLSMDTWSEQQLEMMRQGGNGRLRDYFATLNREELKSEKNEAWDTFYKSKDADNYRDILKVRVDSILKAGGGVSLPGGEIKKHMIDSSLDSCQATTGGTDRNDKTLSLMRPRLNSGSDSHDDEPYEDFAPHIFTETFYGSSKIGITIKKEAGTQTPVVAKVHPNSQAETKGVEMMDVILSVNNVTMHKYEDVMKAIERSLRPIRLSFMRRPSQSKLTQPALTGSQSVPSRRKSSSLSELKNKPAALTVTNLKAGGHSSHHRSPSISSTTLSAIGSAKSTPNKKQHGVSSSNGSGTPRTLLKGSSSSSRGATGPGVSGSPNPTKSPKPNPPSSSKMRSGTSPLSGAGKHNGNGNSDSPASKQRRQRSGSGTFISSGRSSPAGSTTPRCNTSERGDKRTPRSKNGTPSSGSSSVTKGRSGKTSGMPGMSSNRERTASSMSTPSLDSQESPRSRTSSTEMNIFNITGEAGVRAGNSRVSSPSFGLDALGITRGGSPSSPVAASEEWIRDRNINKKLEQARSLPREYRIVFEKAPLGLTVARNNSTGIGWVSKVTEGGQAEQRGVQMGDQLVGIENNWVGTYDDVVADLSSQKFPLALVFRRNVSP